MPSSERRRAVKHRFWLLLLLCWYWLVYVLFENQDRSSWEPSVNTGRKRRTTRQGVLRARGTEQAEGKRQPPTQSKWKEQDMTTVTCPETR